MRPRSVGVIRLPDLAVGGRIMKLMTREQLFAAPKLARRAKARFDRGMGAVSAARIRAMEIAKQCADHCITQTPLGEAERALVVKRAHGLR
jgi:hypothetical protein